MYVRIFIKNLHSSKNEKIHQEKILSFLYNLFYFGNPSFLIIPCPVTPSSITEHFVHLRILRCIISNTISKEKSQLQKKQMDIFIVRPTTIRTNEAPLYGFIQRTKLTSQLRINLQLFNPSSFVPPPHSSSIFISPSTVNCNHGVFFSLRSYTEIKRDKIGGGGERTRGESVESIPFGLNNRD